MGEALAVALCMAILTGAILAFVWHVVVPWLVDRYEVKPLEDEACNKAPIGWICTREPGHDGPCAAVPRASAHPCFNGCQYAKDVGMVPHANCAVACQYEMRKRK